MHILVPFSFSDKKAVQNMGGKMPDHQGEQHQMLL